MSHLPVLNLPPEHQPVYFFAPPPEGSGHCAVLGCTCGFRPEVASSRGSNAHQEFDAHVASLGLPKTHGNIVDPPFSDDFHADKRVYQERVYPELFTKPVSV